MALYTMELRDYIEMWSQDTDSLSNADRVEQGRTKLFDFDYPIFDETYRKDFETHFIRNFYMREIGFEAEGLFKFQLETWLLINMPYWNKMYESELLNYDPLKNSSMDVTHNKTNDKSQTGSSSSSDSSNGNSTVTDDKFHRILESDNPDTRLALTTNDGQGVIEYASNIEENNENDTRNVTNSQNGSSTVNANSNENDTENFIQHRDGKIGVQSYPKMIQKHRQALLRIDKMIFDEMNELFMLVY